MIFKTSRIRKTEKLIESQMLKTTDDMAVIDGLYSDFRKIRHDFANYVQSSQFESEDEDFILRLRVLKKQTLALINELLPRIEAYIDTDQTMVINRYEWLGDIRIFLPQKTDAASEVLISLWTQMKEYYKKQLRELVNVKTILLHLQDRLERSLPPDEYEAKFHLDECDSVQCHITADHVLIAAYAYIFKKECQNHGAAFRFQLPVPKTFEGKYCELFYLLGLAKQQAQEYLNTLPEKEASEQTETVKSLVRIRFAVGMGLWHFTLEYGNPAEEEDDEIEEENTGVVCNFMKTDKYLHKILKKRDAVMQCEQHKGMMCIDIAG